MCMHLVCIDVYIVRLHHCEGEHLCLIVCTVVEESSYVCCIPGCNRVHLEPERAQHSQKEGVLLKAVTSSWLPDKLCKHLVKLCANALLSCNCLQNSRILCQVFCMHIADEAATTALPADTPSGGAVIGSQKGCAGCGRTATLATRLKLASLEKCRRRY